VLAADTTFVSLADLVRCVSPTARPSGDGVPGAASALIAGDDTVEAVRFDASGSARSDAACEHAQDDDAGWPAAADAQPGVPDAAEATPICAAPGNPPNPGAGELLREARIFRAALADALDLAATRLAAVLADEVLGRELTTAPADIANIVVRLVGRYAAEEPLRLRVAHADANVVCGVPVVADPALRVGDAILECRTGTIDARLDVRLAVALAELNR
jgi:hypothetical protein